MVIAQDAERAAKLSGQMKGVRDATRRICNGPQKKIDMVRDKTGKPLTNEEKVRPGEVEGTLGGGFEQTESGPSGGGS